MTPYYKNRLEAGQVYQDFVAEILWCNGIGTVSYASRLFQHGLGENKAKMEIKFDDKFAATGNLWIEVGEKARPRPGPYVPSGIMRDCTEYIIGDYDVIFRIPTNLLRAIHDRGTYRVRENNMKTSQGFLMPGKKAENIAIQVFRPQLSTEMKTILTTQGKLDREQAEILAQMMLIDPRQGALFS